MSAQKSLENVVKRISKLAWQADNSVKNYRNSPISNPKANLHIINAPFGENPLIYTSSHLETKIQSGGQMPLSKIDELCPLAIQTRAP